MRFAPLVLITILPICLATSMLAQGRRFGGQEPVLKHLTHKVENFDSPAVGGSMPYGVYLPKDYDKKSEKNTRWPMVVWLHGMWEDHKRFHTRRGGSLLDQAVGEGLLPPCVFVLANGSRTSMYINAGKGKNYQDLVQKDLMKHITKTYRVSKDRSKRALMGISMGGMAALRIGFNYPDLFGTIAVHSSAVFPPDPQQLPPQLLRRAAQFGLDDVFGNPIDEELWAKTNPLGIAASLDPKSLHGLRLYFDAGSRDRYNFGAPNEALHKVLAKRKVEHTFQLIEGGGHAWGSGFKNESLLTSLKFVGDGFRGLAKSSEKNGGKDGSATPGKDGK